MSGQHHVRPPRVKTARQRLGTLSRGQDYVLVGKASDCARLRHGWRPHIGLVPARPGAAHLVFVTRGAALRRRHRWLRSASPRGSTASAANDDLVDDAHPLMNTTEPLLGVGGAVVVGWHATIGRSAERDRHGLARAA